MRAWGGSPSARGWPAGLLRQALPARDRYRRRKQRQPKHLASPAIQPAACRRMNVGRRTSSAIPLSADSSRPHLVRQFFNLVGLANHGHRKRVRCGLVHLGLQAVGQLQQVGAVVGNLLLLRVGEISLGLPASPAGRPQASARWRRAAFARRPACASAAAGDSAASRPAPSAGRAKLMRTPGRAATAIKTGPPGYTPGELCSATGALSSFYQCDLLSWTTSTSCQEFAGDGRRAFRLFLRTV